MKEKKYIKNNKIWWFLFRFFGTYFFLFLGYSIFLVNTQTKVPAFVSDSITQQVAHHTEWLLNLFGKNAYTEQHSNELSVKLFINHVFVARVIEGCNAMSVIILFVAFVIAFKGSFKNTVLFLIVGVATIYIVNIVRISILSYGLLHFKSFEFLLHDLIFPAIIYGYVFMLWVVWVRCFSDFKKQQV